MDLTGVALPPAWTAGAWIAAAALLLWALSVAPWGRFADSESVHVWYGTIFGQAALWSIQATVGDGFTFHLLGVAVSVLLSGVPLALVGAAVAVAVNVAVHAGLWVNGPLVWLTMAALPAAATAAALRVGERRLPPNFFVYVFVGAFFGGALSFAAAGAAGAAVLVAAAGQPADIVLGQYLPYLGYLAFGEATLTGMVVTLAVVYRPSWVTTFDDARYLDGR
jgi:uncharacterized membrane protein